MDRLDELITQSYHERPVRPQAAQRVLARLDRGWRWTQRVLAVALVVVVALCLVTLGHANLDLLVPVLVSWSRYGVDLGELGPLFLQPLPWLSLAATFLLAVMLALVHRRRSLARTAVTKERSNIMKIMLKKPGLAVAILATVAMTLMATSAYAAYQSHLRAPLSRATLEQRLQVEGQAANEAEIPTNPSGIVLPDCATSTSPTCIYHFGDTDGGDVIVVPVADFAGSAKMQALGRDLYEQSKKNLANRNLSGRVTIMSSRGEAQTVPVSVQATQDHRALTPAEQAASDQYQLAPMGEWVCSLEGGCALHYNDPAPGATKADWADYAFGQAHQHTIIYGQPSAAVQQQMDAARAAAQNAHR